MTEIAVATEAVKTRKRQAVKALKVAKTAEPKDAKLTLYVQGKNATRLKLHALMLDSDASTLIDALIEQHLRQFKVSDMAKDDGQAMPIESAN